MVENIQYLGVNKQISSSSRTLKSHLLLSFVIDTVYFKKQILEQILSSENPRSRNLQNVFTLEAMFWSNMSWRLATSIKKNSILVKRNSWYLDKVGSSKTITKYGNHLLILVIKGYKMFHAPKRATRRNVKQLISMRSIRVKSSSNFPSNFPSNIVGVKLCWGLLPLTWLALVWLPYPVSHFDAVCFLFSYPLQRTSNWFNGFRSFTPLPHFPLTTTH